MMRVHLYPSLFRKNKSCRLAATGRIRGVLLCAVIAALGASCLNIVTRSSLITYTSTTSTVDTVSEAARQAESSSNVTPWSLKESTSIDIAALKKDGDSIAIVVPGFGHIERLPLLNATLRALQRSTDESSVSFACIVYVWNDKLLQVATETFDLCAVEFSTGLWTHHMLAVGSSPATKTIVDTATHVAVMMDDMDTHEVSLPFMLQMMKEANLDVAGPSVPDWSRPSCATRANCMAHLTGHIDILFTIFTHPMWTCWHRHLDVNINEYGWGFDLTMADLCHAEMGIVDHQIAYHRPDCAETDKAKCKIPSYDGNKAFAQMFEWIKVSMNYTTHPEANQYFHEVGVHRPERMPYCRLVKFHWSKKSQRIDAIDTLGGWQSVAMGLNQTSFITVVDETPHNHLGSVELVESVDVQITPVIEPWVGFIHSTWNKHLPSHILSDIRVNDSLSLNATLDSDSFRQSAPKCIALFVFTTTMATAVSDKLHQIGIKNVKVCTVHHPALHHPLEDSVFDAVNDLKAALTQTSSVVLLGHKQYSRVASLHKLKTTRTKFWLSDGFDSAQVKEDKIWFDDTTRADLVAESVAIDPSVTLKRLETQKEYNLFLRRNLVLVDVWAAGAIDAVVRAITLQAPFFIRKLDGPVEYLGENYPLFFTNLDQVQELFNDETELRQKMLDAHNYLKLLNSTYTYTPSFLAEEIQKCTLDGMAEWVKPAMQWR